MEFGNRKLAASAAILAGTLSLAGCSTHYYNANGKSHAPTIGHNSMVAEGVTFSCDGANLRIDDPQYTGVKEYLNDPACADDQFTVADIKPR